jgi:hypothetical protein
MPKYRAQKIDYRDADNEKTEGKMHVHQRIIGPSGTCACASHQNVVRPTMGHVNTRLAA